MSLSKQNQRVMDYLESGNAIDPLKSWNEIGVYRLASRINELINKHGVEIKKGWKKSKNRYGEIVKVREYWI